MRSCIVGLVLLCVTMVAAGAQAQNGTRGAQREGELIASALAPRLLAATIAMPLLVLVADVLGVMGGWVIGTFRLDFSSAAYLRSTFDFLQAGDVLHGLSKSAVFGFVVALMGCWFGYTSRGGAQGVGGATTSAVVSSSILILALDYVLTDLLFAR